MRAPRLFAPSYLALLMLCAGALLAEPAIATAAKAPEYSLSIVEGESTLPEEGLAHTSASVVPQASVAITIIRGGVAVARSTGTDGGAWMSQVPQPGDIVTLESPIGTTVGAPIYDGLPSIDPTVCAGSANFSGQRTGLDPVEGGYYTLVPHTPYGPHRVGQGQAQVTVLSGSTYGGGFLTPLALGQTVFASESLQTQLSTGAVFTYSSETDRPVGACPAPPPPPPPPPPPALQGSVFKLLKTTIQKFLKSGWLDQVTINQPGTVVQDLYLQDGKLPAFAAGKKGKHHARKVPPAQLVARGSTTAKSAGTVNVLIRVTAKGRHLLRGRKQVRMVLITTLRSGTGKLTLARRSVTLHR